MDTFKPYLIRAIFECCIDKNLDPQILVEVDKNCEVPNEFVVNDQIALSLHPEAALNLVLDHHFIHFEGYFNLDNPSPQSVYIPIERVAGIYSVEDTNGLFFDVQPSTPRYNKKNNTLEQATHKPLLKIIK
jgi:stringent starvation protein B